MPTKFGIGFGFKQLNQAGALVHIYTDGEDCLFRTHTVRLSVATRNPLF